MEQIGKEASCPLQSNMKPSTALRYACKSQNTPGLGSISKEANCKWVEALSKAYLLVQQQRCSDRSQGEKHVDLSPCITRQGKEC